MTTAGAMAFTAGTSGIPCALVEISVSCRNLRDCDVFSKSDPMCVLLMEDFSTKKFHEHGRSEVIKDNLNPDFIHKFNVNFYFEVCQKLKFEIYDVDSSSQKLENHDFLGRIECTLGEIVGSPTGHLEKPLRGPAANNGTICLRAEELSQCKEVLTLQFRASKLDKKDFFGKSDPFLIFYRAGEDGTYSAVHKTEVIMNTLNPTWKPFTIKVRTLCNGDYLRSVKVSCYDWNKDQNHDFIGEFTTNVQELTSSQPNATHYEVINQKKKAKKKGYKNSGTVQLLRVEKEQEYTFLDYIKGGTQMNFTVAIDFTASNGNPSNPSSLHYLNPYQLNQYGSAIQAIGEIIQDYDSDKMFPVLGFGARMADGSVLHEFAVNFNPQNPYCTGINGILQAYYAALQRVQLYGPTNFAPVINHVSRFASSMDDGSRYFVLLIITDGVITDMYQTVQAIVKASVLPMSIIIVGVGDADFEAMNILDGDDARLSVGGQVAQRDIVQFVPFRDFIGERCGYNMEISRTFLAKELIAEIPEQFLSYMKHKGVRPNLV